MEDLKFGQAKALVVDDIESNRMLLSEFLSKANLDVTTANNGQEAVLSAKELKPAIILMDIRMPVMNGIDAANQLKSDIKYSHIPVIFLTAKSETADIIKGFEVGGVDYVTKPVIAEELLARVKTHLEIKNLRHHIPICASCKKIRDDEGLWSLIEVYFAKHTNAQFSHGICGECAEELYGGLK